MAADELIINIEGNIDDRLASIRYLVRQLAPLRAAAPQAAAGLDLTRLQYLGPDGATLIAGAILEAHAREVRVRVSWPAEPPALVAFIDFAGLGDFLAGRAGAGSNHPKNVTVPLRRFDRSRHGDPEPVIRLVSRFEPVSDDLRMSLEIAMNECIQNVEDHASSPVGGISCARFMREARQVRVALADWGEGICRTLRRRYPDTRDDRHALERVLFGGYSAMTRRNNLGRGIDNLRSVVTESFGGDLCIVSGNAAVEVAGRREPCFHTLPAPFNGTAVFFTLPTRPVA